MSSTNYRFQIRQTNPYDVAETGFFNGSTTTPGYGFQLLLFEGNSSILIWSDDSVANCKTQANGIFDPTYVTSGMVPTSSSNATLFASTAFIWSGDLSDGTNDGQQVDLIWADAPLSFANAV